AIRAATFRSQTQSQGCALPAVDIFQKTSTRKCPGIPRRQTETTAAARKQPLSQRDKGGKLQNRTLRRWIGFSEDDERIQIPCFHLRRCRVDLPAVCFNQYNVPIVAAIELLEPFGFRSHSNKGQPSKMNKELDALERKLEIRNRELMDAHGHIAALEEKL